jgi:hypothetical protein
MLGELHFESEFNWIKKQQKTREGEKKSRNEK